MRIQYSLDRNALFSDESANYRVPEEPEAGDRVKIRFRAGYENVDSIYLMYQTVEHKMKKVCSTGVFDYYEAEVQLGEEPLTYYFEVVKDREHTYYDKTGCTSVPKEQYHFKVTPGFHTPAWAKGAVIYQIYVDRFFNGEPANDPLSHEYSYVGGHSLQVTDWNKYPDTLDVRCFYGGDLQGVWQKLDYLQSLGVDVIYFNPLFVSPSNHKYDIQDYDYIDPHFAVIQKDEGELLPDDSIDNSLATRYISRVTSKENLEASNAFFAELMEEIHKRGMRVILDGVFNHCGSFNKWMDRERIYEGAEGYEAGAYESKDSQYRDFFDFWGNHWPYNGQYEGWWGHDTLPKLNFEGSQTLYEYVMRIGAKWVSAPYHVDGWRLDVAADLGHSEAFNHKFWRDFRKSVKTANPESIILAEHYGDPSAWIQGDQWDTVMNYDAFMEPVTWFLTGLEKHSDEFNGNLYGNGEWFFNAMIYNISKFQRPSLDVAMNELSNHDHSRFLTRTNHTVGRTNTLGAEAADQNVNKGIMKEAVVIQMTWPGAPTIYYGDEAGLAGWTDPDNRRTFPWGREDWDLVEFHRYMIRIHKEFSCFISGSVKPLLWGAHIIAYGRFDGRSKAVIAINNRAEEQHMEIPVWEAEVPFDCQMLRVMESNRDSYNVGRTQVEVHGGVLRYIVKGYSAVVFVYECENFQEI